MHFLFLTREPRLYTIKRFVEECRKRGHETSTVDVLKANLVLHQSRPQLYYLGEQVRPSRYDVAIPRIGTSVTEAGCAVVNQLEMMGVPVLNPSQAILRARDKLRSLQALSRLSVDMPKTVVIRRSQDIDHGLRMVGGTPCVLKLLQGTQGIGVMLVESREAIESVLQAFWSLGQVILLQEFIKESKGKDVRAFVVGDKVVAAMRRQAKLGEFRSNIHRGGLGVPIELSADDQLAVIEAAHAMGLQCAGVDYLESRTGPKIIEVNASPGFKGLEQATHSNIAGSIVDYAVEHARRMRA